MKFNGYGIGWWVLIVIGIAHSGCFRVGGAPQRRYYVLQAVNPMTGDAKNDSKKETTATVGSAVTAVINGLVRVRDLNVDSTYDKNQIVVRHSPFEITYQERNVWAVKPHRMISDEVARAFTESAVFSSVARDLGERRPHFVLAGDLYAIEIADAGIIWKVHLAFALNMSRYDTGEVVWTYHFDENNTVGIQEFSQAVRALSGLLAKAIDQAKLSLQTAVANQPNMFVPSPSSSSRPSPSGASGRGNR